MNSWPLQSNCDSFYGNPRGIGGGHVNEAWYSQNIVIVKLPFEMRMGTDPITRISIHKKCAASVLRVFTSVAPMLCTAAFKIPDYNYDGSFNYRVMRGGRSLSMHAYGCAIDLDAEHNPMGKKTVRFKDTSIWVKAFEAEGWVWGGRWSSPDAMHFQAALVG